MLLLLAGCIHTSSTNYNDHHSAGFRTHLTTKQLVELFQQAHYTFSPSCVDHPDFFYKSVCSPYRCHLRTSIPRHTTIIIMLASGRDSPQCSQPICIRIPGFHLLLQNPVNPQKYKRTHFSINFSSAYNTTMILKE